MMNDIPENEVIEWLDETIGLIHMDMLENIAGHYSNLEKGIPAPLLRKFALYTRLIVKPALLDSVDSTGKDKYANAFRSFYNNIHEDAETEENSLFTFKLSFLKTLEFQISGSNEVYEEVLKPEWIRFNKNYL